ncbi:MAG: hypothetical protein PHI27_11605 [Eubacteriales bacterium]|nr:hypothetical protein [Eubacteriales bacterium]MDD3882875.1 hypothetical protein [Eubacteriales bacterium]MDD4512089.1 hypothetical protein [Eubacteriales bacterium]
MEWLTSLTGSNLLIALVVLCALLWLYNLIAEAVRNHRELKKPLDARAQNITARLDEYDTYFANDKRRIEQHDKEIATLRDGLKVNCFGVKALLNHELHNGNAQEMQKAASDMDAWLINK